MTRIVRIAAKGEGVAEDGRFVPLAAPEDEVDAAGVVMAGPHHATPPCRHFPRCGGCQLQHVDDAAYGAYLIDRVTGALNAQRLDAGEIRRPYLSPPRSRRRASLRAERIGNRVVIGFNESASHRIVDIAECHVLRPELFALVAPLRAMLPAVLKRGRVAEVRMTLADQGVDVLLSGVMAEGLDASEAITGFAGRYRLARLAIDDGYGPQPWWEPEAATISLGGVAVPLVPGAFLQATADGEAALLAGVVEAVGDAARIADLFAGLGTFALPIAARAKVLAVEGARDPILALKAAAARAGKAVIADHRDLFRRPLTGKELAGLDAIVLDPPRAGAKEQVAEIANAGVARLAYVSCNPATFARDARTLIDGGWRLHWVQPVGQFRWSTHVELVARFTRD